MSLALEQRLAAYTSVATAFAEAMKDKQIVPQVVISGGGDEGGNNSTSALNLINLIMSKVALDLGTRITDQQLPLRGPAPQQQ